MKLSIIILTWNSEQYIDTCLTALLGSITEGLEPCEIFVVDNGSKDQSRIIIEKFRSKNPNIIKPIFLESNSGTTYSRNIALRKASGDFVAIIDSDVFVPQGIFQSLLDVLNESPRIGMIAPRLVYANGNFQKSTDDFPTVLTKLRRFFFLKKIEQNDSLGEFDSNQFVDYAISAFWLFKKEVLEKVGLLDENIFYAPEDVDYCLRIWKAGYKILYVPSHVVVHDAQEISRGFRPNKAFRAHLKGLFYYFCKHRYVFKQPLLK